MAFTFTDLKNSIRALFGENQTRTSGDGGGDVSGHVSRLAQRYVPCRASAAAVASGTSSYAMLPIFVAEEECNVVGARMVIDSALTLTVTDYIVMSLIKKKSPTFSATQAVATLNVGQTSAWTVNVAGTSKAFTMASTESVIDMDAGDTLSLNGTLNGANAIGVPANFVHVAVEEK